jgi:hypothetical protein
MHAHRRRRGLRLTGVYGAALNGPGRGIEAEKRLAACSPAYPMSSPQHLHFVLYHTGSLMVGGGPLQRCEGMPLPCFSNFVMGWPLSTCACTIGGGIARGADEGIGGSLGRPRSAQPFSPVLEPGSTDGQETAMTALAPRDLGGIGVRAVIVLLALALALPGGALANHVEEYRYNPVEHDDQGRSDEPDFVSTSVLGPALDNCFLELPVAGAFHGACTRPLPQPVAGQSAALAPGCTGAGVSGEPERKPSGLCGLWTVGLTESMVSPTFFGPGLVAPQMVPVAEQGLPGSAAPGAFTPTKASTVRFLDGHFQMAIHAPFVAVNRYDGYHKLADARALLGPAVPPSTLLLPGQQQNALWYGQWTDLNGNGVIDHVTPGSAGSTRNEYAWLGSCIDYETGVYYAASIPAGLCIEDPNPNAAPPGRPCGATSSPSGCAATSVVAWHWPGNHHAIGGAVAGVAEPGVPGDFPGQQLLHWFVDECAGYDGCDEPDVLYQGDPLLGPQDARLVDESFADFTGSFSSDHSDIYRDWHPGSSASYGYSNQFYGDDGLLVTMLSVYGANCVELQHWYAYDPATCTFYDVDRQGLANEAVDLLVVGQTENPTGGVKGLVRSAWLLVRDFEA